MTEITLRQKKYPLLFDLNAVEAIQKRYGAVSKLSEKLADFAEVRWILTLLINEGIAYRNYMEGTNDKAMEEYQIGMLISFSDIRGTELGEAITQALNEGTDTQKN